MVAMAALGGAFSAQATPLASPRELGLPHFTAFHPRDYRGHTQVWSAVQDAAGLIYFGNYGRVLVYDGASWTHLEVPNTSFVRALAIDADDTLWIGAVDEIGFARTGQDGQRVFVSLKERLPADARNLGELWRVVLGPHGPVFISNSRVLRWNGHAFSTLALAPSGGWQLLRVGDALWVTHGRNGWFRLEDDGATLSLAPISRPANFEGGSIFFALPSGQPNEFLLGSLRGGLWRWREGEISPFPTEADESLKSQLLYQGVRLADGRIALCTLQGGAILLDPQGRLLARLNENSGLPDNTALSAFADRFGALWLSLEKGLVRVDARPWLSAFGASSGVPKTALSSPVRFRNELLVPTVSGLYRLVPGSAGTSARLELVPGLPDYITAAKPLDGTLFVWGPQGIGSWDGSRPTWWTDPALSDVYAFVASRAHAERWFVLANGAVIPFRRQGDAWTNEGALEGLPHIRSLSEDADGNYWLGTPNQGVFRLRFPHATSDQLGAPDLKRYGTAEGLPERHGWTRVSIVGDRPLLTSERGLFRYDAHTDRFVPTAEFGAQFADGSMTTRTFTPDRDGGLWLAARPAGQAELVTTLQVGLADARGWHPVHLPQLAQLDDVQSLHYEAEEDVLWIAGHGGLLRLELAPWRKQTNATAPTVHLRTAETEAGRKLSVAAGWQLPFAQRYLRLNFAAPELAGDTETLFESTLVGESRPLVQTSSSPQREFAALSPGRYLLSVRARGTATPWSEPLEIAFTVLPPWWRSPWAFAGYAVLLLAGMAGAIAYRTRALRRRAEKLEAIVATRTEELRRSNEELARLHRLELDEKIAARLAEEKARLEVLRYQLNPHFLFNALTSVCAQLPPSLSGARMTIEKLTDFCQATLFRDEQNEHPLLADELKMLSAYLEIEKVRWGDELTLEVSIDPATSAARIPSLLLLPLVENALKYGRETSRGALGIRLLCTLARDGAVVIEVANTGCWLERAAPRGLVPSLGIGLENLRQRLQRYYPGAHELATLEADGWVTVRLRLLRPQPQLAAAAAAV